MKKIVLLGMIAVAVNFMGCEESSPLLPETDNVVVQAYLYTNEAVTDIHLSTTYAITSEDTTGVPINNAMVSLEKAGLLYQLVSTPGGEGYYHYPGNDLNVNIGDNFKIIVDYDNEIITGETIIPDAPLNVNISTENYVISTDFFASRFDTSTVRVRWDLENEDTYYFVIIENTETNLAFINERFGDLFNRFRSFRSRPIQDNEYVIRRFDLTYKGNYEVRVYKVNQEYADLYVFGLQDSRNLNEPKTNIKNGLGVFAGFTSTAVHFNVTTN